MACGSGVGVREEFVVDEVEAERVAAEEDYGL